jgi:hypothetical protein
VGKINWQAALLAWWHFTDASVIPIGVVDSQGELEAHNFLHSSYNRYTCSWPSIGFPIGNIRNTFSSTLISYNGSLLHATSHCLFASHPSGEENFQCHLASTLLQAHILWATVMFFYQLQANSY